MASQPITDGRTDGVLIASATGKAAFYGGTPVVQRSGAVQAAVTTTAATSTSPIGYSTNTQADRIVALLNEVRAVLVGMNQMAGA